MTPAQTRRIDAVADLFATLMPESNGYKVADGLTRENVADAIRELYPLGRTDRWRQTLDRWVGMVTDDSNPLDWAIAQGTTYAGYAAE